MTMPDSWVDRIFDKLTMVYGHHFIGRWSGLDLNKVKSDWGHELSGFEDHGDAIKFALQNLPPDHPPTVLQFREMCRRAPQKQMDSLPAPSPNPEIAAAALQEAAKAINKTHDALHPIRKLMWREIEGDKRLTKAQREFWRIALHDEIRKACGMNTKELIDLMELSKALHHMRVET